MTTADPSTNSHPAPLFSGAIHAIDRLVERMDRAGTPACVGLDPVVERLPAALSGWTPVERVARFSLGVIEAIAPHVPVVKVQAACYERYGSTGWSVLERVVKAARQAGLFVILDAKRGDIATSAEHYAQAAAAVGADAITVNPYLGPSGIIPFLEHGLVVFALVRTSNPDSDVLQQARLQDGSTVAEIVALMLHEVGEQAVGSRGISALGAVVGATKADASASLRDRMPDAMFLTPGIGAQGATTQDAARLCRASRSSVGDAGLLPTASRSVLYPEGQSAGHGWQREIAEAAMVFAKQAQAAVR